MSSFMQGVPRLPVTDSIEWLGWFNNAQTVLYDMANSGTTAQRPTQQLYVGKPYFDTTLGFAIWLKSGGASPVWVNASGAPV